MLCAAGVTNSYNFRRSTQTCVTSGSHTGFKVARQAAGFPGMWKACKMGKLYLSIMIGALLMAAVDKWKHGDFSAGQMMAMVQDDGRLRVSVQR